MVRHLRTHPSTFEKYKKAAEERDI